jgi:cyclopropane-fatty-acyl-phospholipid synthase
MVLFGGSVGAGEAYFKKIWDTDDLTALVRIMVLNMALLNRLDSGLSWVRKPLDLFRHLRRNNSKKTSKKNILAHYDLGNRLYESFLDPELMYSSAIYPTTDTSLDEASQHKLQIICERLQLRPTDRVIEIGSGWGGFAIYAAKNFGCHVTTTTISDAQYEKARERIENAGLGDRITLLNRDYRDLDGRYDKLVSIEMIEAVGQQYLATFFAKCNHLLKKDGLMLLQAITIADQNFRHYARSVDFIQRYIFPGGCIPSNQKMLELISAKTDMVVRRIEDFGMDYAKTLRDWRHRFNHGFADLTRHGYDDSFRRLWNFYLCYCEGGFLERSISVVHLVATKPNNRDRV